MTTRHPQTNGFDLFTFARSVRRRWPILFLGVVATAVSLYLVADRIEPEFQAVGSVLVQNVNDQSEGAPSQTRSVNNYVLAEILESDEVVEDLAEDGFVAAYDVIAEENGGILRVEADGIAPDGLVGTVSAVLERAEQELLERQEANGSVVDPDAFRLLAAPTVADAESFVAASTESPAMVNYRARGSAVIASLSFGANPFSANNYTTRVLTASMQSPTVVEALDVDEVTTRFAVETDPRDPAPIVSISVAGTSDTEVLALYQRIEAALRERLLTMQDDAGVADGARLELVGLAVPGEAVLASTNLTRPIIAIAALGLLASVTLAVAFDTMMTRRSRRREVASLPTRPVVVPPIPPDADDVPLFRRGRKGDARTRREVNVS